MSANRLFTLFVASVLVVVIAFAAEVAHSSANSMDRESKEQAQREYELDEQNALEKSVAPLWERALPLSYLSRLNPCFDISFSELASCPNAIDKQYQELPGYIRGFSPEQIPREYMLGERSGQTP